MDLEEEALLWLLLRQRRRRRRSRIYWVHPIIQNRTESQFHQLYPLLRMYDDKFFNYFRMSKNTFDYLSNELKNSLDRNDTPIRKSISSVERLAIAIRYLATGCSFKEIHYSFRCGATTASEIVRDVCLQIWTKLQPTHLPKPNTEMWKDIANTFKIRTNFPNCVGAIDGKHIHIIHPRDSGSLYWNFKHFFSIVLLAVCDANYLFVYVDIGAYGKTSDSTIWKDSSLYELLQTNEIDLPEPEPVSTEGSPLPYSFIGDEAFGLGQNLLRPYSGKQLTMKKRVFNYRLSRARRNVESSFGILSNKWRIFHRPLNVSDDFATDIVKACVILHNVVRKRDGYNYEDTLSLPADFIPFENNLDFRVGRTVNSIRDKFADFFVSPEGELPWQYKIA